MRQVETPSKRTIFGARQIYLVARHNFNVACVVTLYNDPKTSKCCNKCIISLTTCEVLRDAASFFSAFVGCIIKHLFHENLCCVTFCLRLIALYKRLTVTSFYVQNVIEHRFSLLAPRRNCSPGLKSESPEMTSL